MVLYIDEVEFNLFITAYAKVLERSGTLWLKTLWLSAVVRQAVAHCSRAAINHYHRQTSVFCIARHRLRLSSKRELC